MADLHASAEEINILTSIVKYLEANIQGTAGPPTDIQAAAWWWPGRKYDPHVRDYFVRVSLQETEGRYYSTVDGANPGSLKDWMLRLELFMKRQAQGLDLTKFPNTLTLLRSAFRGDTHVAVLDYRGAQAALGDLIVRGRERLDPVPEEDWLSAGWAIRLEWIEQDATA